MQGIYKRLPNGTILRLKNSSCEHLFEIDFSWYAYQHWRYEVRSLVNDFREQGNELYIHDCYEIVDKNQPQLDLIFEDEV